MPASWLTVMPGIGTLGLLWTRLLPTRALPSCRGEATGTVWGMNGNFLFLDPSQRDSGWLWLEKLNQSVLRPRISPNTNQHWLLPACCLWLCRVLSVVAAASGFCLLPRKGEQFVGESWVKGRILSPSQPLPRVKNSDYQMHCHWLAFPPTNNIWR